MFKKRPYRLIKNVKAVSVAVALLGTLSLSYNGGQAAADPSPAVPDYEVKLLLSSGAVLDSNHELKSAVRSYFGMPSSKTKISLEFLDTGDLELNEEGWNVRVRKMEDYDDEEFELTYKKRYPIANGDIDAALAQAALDGFDADEDDYEAQVDWGYQKQTLSFSNKKSVDQDGYDGMENLSKDDAIDAAIDEAPGKFEDWGSGDWGTDLLEDAHLYGPVSGKRWTGTWSGDDLDIEVYEILQADGSGYDYVAEASFKTDSRSDAATLKSKLQAELTRQGWFLPGDELKTQMILDRY